VTAKPKYESLADDLAAMIETKVIADGGRMPSLRTLARMRGLSIPTVSEAYRLLEDRGLIESRPRSGYFTLRAARLGGPSASRPSGRPVAVAGFAQALQGAIARAGLAGAPSGAAAPSPSFFPVTRLRSLLSKALRRRPYLLGEYAFAPGLPDLRRQIARRAAGWGCSLDSEGMVVTNGAVEAIDLCLKALTRRGDIVAVESPCYYGFLHLLDVHGLQALEVSTDSQKGLDVDALETALNAHPIRACLLSTTVTNPTGATMPEAAKRRLVELLAERSVPLIEDATFADLHGGSAAMAARAFDRIGNVLLCASLTKTVAPGLRVGWVEAGKHAERVAFLKRVSSVGQPAIIEEVLAEYLADGGIDRHLRRLRGRFARLVRQHTDMVALHFPQGARIVNPTGGFLLWVELPAGYDVTRRWSEISNVGLSLAAGPMFSAAGAFRNALRINAGVEWTSATSRAYESLRQLL
jgi:DNA-binding transcriptional MocR family regulator